MDISKYFPIWEELTAEQQKKLQGTAVKTLFHQGDLLPQGCDECPGVYLVASGQLRAYIISNTGKEITLFRLLNQDICLFSASCLFSGIQFHITIEAEKDSELWLIPTDVYKSIHTSSAPMANYTSELLASHFSDVMWLMDQILFQSLDTRLAAFLLEESSLESSTSLSITHEKIARHLGTAREVVTRMLRYFQSEEILTLSRGGIQILKQDQLSKIAAP